MEKQTYLTYIEDAGRIQLKNGTIILVRCKCICGKIKVIRKQKFTSKSTISCGCMKGKKIKEASITHGMSNTRTYRCWASMITRCTNKKIPQFKNYGGRGIRVCERWVNSFENFLSDMWECPSKEHSIDRIEVNENYEPSNCKWSTTLEQCNNKTNNVKYLYNGELLSVTEISRITGITRSRISNWKNRSKYSKEKIEKLIQENSHGS